MGLDDLFTGLYRFNGLNKWIAILRSIITDTVIINAIMMQIKNEKVIIDNSNSDIENI